MAVVLLFLISFGVSWVLEAIDILFASIALGTGVSVAIVIGNFYKLETLFVGGNLATMGLFFVVVAVAPFLPEGGLELLSICYAMLVVGAASGIVVQWLANNWLRQSFGIVAGLVISVLAIASGIIAQYYASVS